jgi:septal ring factor EnvC (AmiA/AmiB activator)
MVNLHGVRRAWPGIGGALLAVAIVTTGPLAQTDQPPTAAKVAERLRALQRESDELAAREKTLLVELRQLELQRQIRTEELAGVDAELRRAEQDMARAQARAASLSETTQAARPDIEARMVRLYKMGRGGYWRLLLGSEDIRAVGRAYRTAAAMSALDRSRVQEHDAMLKTLSDERAAIQKRTADARLLRDRALAARGAIDRAVAERTALVASIDGRRDLAAQMASELRAAQQRLERTAGESALPAAPPASNVASPGEKRVPLRTLKGDLPWPAGGIVLQRFGRMSTGAQGLAVASNGIDLSVPEGRPVSAVHEGVVTFAAPLTGFGNVVIVDHGDGAQSLYGHLASLDVNKGARVGGGARLGSSGRNVAGNPSLYFELRIDGKPVDPLQWLRPQP